MKKATNSKNRGKISKLFPIMQEHFGKSMNLARIKLMTLLLEALVKAQTVNLVRLANAMPTAVDKESNMRRLQRFLAVYVLDLDLIARMIFSLLPVRSGLVLTMDRTNWKYGQANDHNLLLMSLMEQVARRHHFRVLLHEKPFAGVNGSGKHNNWSLGTDTGVQLFKPGKTAQENLQFITFLSCVMAAVHRYNGLLKASIASAGNAHRLGGNEAPPAIISMFLGTQLSHVLRSLLDDSSDDHLDFAGREGLNLEMSQKPELRVDNTDRNRTSPFAFTGNRFEFRAVGSSANCASAMLALNAAVAQQLMWLRAAVDRRMAAGASRDDAILAEVKRLLRQACPVHFDGNGYTDAWKAEAARRGLDCETLVPRIIDNYLWPEVVEMFSETGVLSKVELEARNEVKWEMYVKKVQIEARVLGDLAINHILPVATRYQLVLLDNVYKIKSLFSPEKFERMTAPDLDMIEKMAHHIQAIKEQESEMEKNCKVANRIEDMRSRAIAYHDKVSPLLETIRYHVDHLELMVDDEMWPLPKYRELLFIR